MMRVILFILTDTSSSSSCQNKSNIYQHFYMIKIKMDNKEEKKLNEIK